jgi:hypothetical protein
VILKEPYHSDRQLRGPRALADAPPLEQIYLKPGLLERLFRYRLPRSEPIGYRKAKKRP